MNLVIQLCKAQLKKRDWNIKKGALERLGECNDPDGLKVLDAFIEDADDRDLTAIAESARERLVQALDRQKQANQELQQRKKIVLEPGDASQTSQSDSQPGQSGSGDEDDEHVQHMDSKFDTDTMTLIDNLENEKSKYVRATLVKELGRKKDPTLIKVIVEYLNDNDSRVVANTIEALGMIKSPVILPYIIPFVNHTNPRIKANVNKILFKFDSHLVLENLRDMIVSTKERNRASALFALMQNPSEETYDILKMGYDDPSPALRAKIRMSIRKMRIQKFVYSLQDPKKLSTVLGGFIGGIFVIYFGLNGLMNFWNNLDHGGNKITSDEGKYSNNVKRRKGQTSAFTMGRRVYSNPRSQKISESWESAGNNMSKFKFQIMPGAKSNSAIIQADFEERLALAHNYLNNMEYSRAEDKLKEVIETSENEYVLYDAFLCMVKIYRKTDRKDEIIGLIKQMEEKCPGLVGFGDENFNYSDIFVTFDKVSGFLGDENSEERKKADHMLEEFARENNISSNQKEVFLKASSEFVDTIRFMGD